MLSACVAFDWRKLIASSLTIVWALTFVVEASLVVEIIILAFG
jgi:hypothetical protein